MKYDKPPWSMDDYELKVGPITELNNIADEFGLRFDYFFLRDVFFLFGPKYFVRAFRGCCELSVRFNRDVPYFVSRLGKKYHDRQARAFSEFFNIPGNVIPQMWMKGGPNDPI